MINETYLEILAYSASAIILISIVMKNIIALRTFNMVGALMFLLYSTIKQDTPVMFINGSIALINAYYIFIFIKNKYIKSWKTT